VGDKKLILEFIALMVSHPSDDYYYYFNTPDSIDPRGKKKLEAKTNITGG